MGSLIFVFTHYSSPEPTQIVPGKLVQMQFSSEAARDPPHYLSGHTEQVICRTRTSLTMRRLTNAFCIHPQAPNRGSYLGREESGDLRPSSQGLRSPAIARRISTLAMRWHMEVPWWLVLLAVVLALAAILDFIGILPRL